MGTLIAVFAVCYAVTFAIGKLIALKLIKPQKDSIFKYLQSAAVRAIFYTPTIGMGGHGVAIVPAGIAMIFTESRYYSTMMIAPTAVFLISLLVSLSQWSRRQANTEKHEEH